MAQSRQGESSEGGIRVDPWWYTEATWRPGGEVHPLDASSPRAGSFQPPPLHRNSQGRVRWGRLTLLTGCRPPSAPREPGHSPPRGSAPTMFQEKLREGFPEEERRALPRRKREKLALWRRVLGYAPWSSAAPAASQSQGRTETPAENTETKRQKKPEGDQAGGPDCPWIRVRSRRRERRPYRRDEHSLPTVNPHCLVGGKATTPGGNIGVCPLNRPETREVRGGWGWGARL